MNKLSLMDTMVRTVNHSKRWCGKNSEYLFAAGIIVGLGVTVYTAIKTTPKVIEKIELDRMGKIEKEEEYTTFDTVKVAVKEYTPTIMSGITTVGLVLAMANNSKSKQRSLALAYTVLHKEYTAFRKHIKDTASHDLSKSLNKNWTEETEKVKEQFDAEHKDDGTMLFFDNVTRSYFNSTVEAIKEAERLINRNITLGKFVTVQEYIEFLGINATRGSEDSMHIGWDDCMLYEEGLPWLDLNLYYETLDVTDDNNQELLCYCVVPSSSPKHEGYVPD